MLTPVCALNGSDPALEVRSHFGLPAFVAVTGTQRPFDRRPASRRVNRRVAPAGSLRAKLNVVPTGVELIRAADPPRFHLAADSLKPVRTGVVPVGAVAGVDSEPPLGAVGTAGRQQR